jgi:hypothetical protein
LWWRLTAKIYRQNHKTHNFPRQRLAGLPLSCSTRSDFFPRRNCRKATALAGWGARIRTQKWRIPKCPLIVRSNFARFWNVSGPETFHHPSCPKLHIHLAAVLAALGARMLTSLQHGIPEVVLKIRNWCRPSSAFHQPPIRLAARAVLGDTFGANSGVTPGTRRKSERRADTSSSTAFSCKRASGAPKQGCIQAPRRDARAHSAA